MDSNHDASDSNRSECYMHKEPRSAWQSLELHCVTHCRNHTNWHEDSCTAAGQLIFLCGGNEELYSAIDKDLDSMGKAKFFLGGVGFACGIWEGCDYMLDTAHWRRSREPCYC
jgi:hypothetical protein